MTESDAGFCDDQGRSDGYQGRQREDMQRESDYGVDEVVESSDLQSEQEPVEEMYLVQGYMLEEARVRQEEFERLLQKQQELRDKPIRVYGRSYEAFDEEIESSDRENQESYPQEKPLLYGAQFQNIVEREERENPVDYFVDELDEDADEVNVSEKPLVQGREFYDIARREDEENPFDYYVDDPNEENEQFEAPVEVPLQQHLVFAKLDEQDRAIDHFEEDLGVRPAGEQAYLKSAKIAGTAEPNAKNQSTDRQNDRKRSPATKPRGSGERPDAAPYKSGSPPTKKDTTFYQTSTSRPREDSDVDIERYYVEEQPLGGYTFDVRADNERLVRGIVQTLAEIDEVVAEVRYLISADL